MAINFITANINGIEKPQQLTMTTVNETGKTIELSTTANNAKDPIYFVVDLKDAHINTRLEIINADGNIAKVVMLMSKGISVLPIKTQNIITKEGQLNFRLTGVSGNIESDFGITVGAFSHIPVINH